MTANKLPSFDKVDPQIDHLAGDSLVLVVSGEGGDGEQQDEFVGVAHSTRDRGCRCNVRVHCARTEEVVGVEVRRASLGRVVHGALVHAALDVHVGRQLRAGKNHLVHNHQWQQICQINSLD